MKSVDEFKKYCKDFVKTAESGEWNMISWELSNGDEIYFKKGFKVPHAISPEPFVGSKYGDFGYEGCISWDVAFNILKADGAFEIDWEE